MSRRTWTDTFARFQPGVVPLVGPVAVYVADWSHPRRGQAPMFTAPWLERLSVAHPAVPLVVFAPAGLWCVWRGWDAWRAAGAAAGAVAVVALYFGGLLAWSLLEYVAHRGSFHHAPSSSRQLALGYVVHGVHHAFPDDARRWVMPLSITVPIAALLYLAMRVAAGEGGLSAFGGFLHGYLTYDLLHYFIHRGHMPTRLGRYLRQYHLAHHYAAPDRHFGVSSPFWDVVFRTR